LGLARFFIFYFLVVVMIWIGIDIVIRSVTHGPTYGPLGPIAQTFSWVVGLLTPLLAIYLYARIPRQSA
jgi:hypothetical protein